MSYFVGYGYESDQCSDDSLTGDCDGFIPANESGALDYCVCACHDIYSGVFESRESVAQYHSDKHRDEQDGAYHNIGYVGG